MMHGNPNIKNLLYSPSVEVIVGKLMALHSVTSAYRKSVGLKLIANENWKNLTINYSQTAVNATSKIATKLREHRLIFHVYLLP